MRNKDSKSPKHSCKIAHNIITKYNNSIFKRVITSMISKPKIFIYTLLLDIGFVTFFLLINYILNSTTFMDSLLGTNSENSVRIIIIAILILIAYLIIILTAYSFFSLIILGEIKKYATNHKHKLNMFKKMFLLNLLLFSIFFVLMTIFNIVLETLKNTLTWITIVVLIIFFLILFIVYVMYNFTHSAFIMNQGVINSLKYALKNIFKKSYLGVVIFSISVMTAYLFVYFLIGILFKNFILENYEKFVNITSIITIIIVYILFSVNRTYFFFITEKQINYKNRKQSN